MSDELNPKTIDTIFGLLKDAPERQIDNANTLDTKMVHIFGAASVVIGLLGLSRNDFGPEWWIIICLIGAIVSYLATAVLAFAHLRPKVFHRSIHGDTLWPHTWDLTDIEIKHTLIADVTAAYAHNKPLLVRKSHTLAIAVVTTAAEVFLVGLAFVLSSVS